MSREILIHIEIGERRVAIIEDGKLVDFLIEVDRHQPILGNIYKGKVETILPSINGAFVNIGQKRNGFLYLTDAVNPLFEDEISGPRKFLNRLLNKKETAQGRKEGQNVTLKVNQDVLVQVVKEPFGNKGARLSTHISLAGRFVVYMPMDQHCGISRRIENLEERQRLKDVFKEFSFAKTGGFIVRTASLEQGKHEILRDGKFLYRIWQQITKLSERKVAPTLIYKEYDLIWRVARDYLTEDVDKLIIDSYEEYIKMRKFVHTLIGRHMVNKIHFYKSEIPLFKDKNVSGELEKIYDRKVNLKSGAYIVIEPTEGLTVVDVNSGKFKTNASPEEAAFRVNMEAAPEIARQLRLRDLGGIIVIDFIDMNREQHKRNVLHVLQEELSRDHAKCEVSRVSALGLVEMTRERTGRALEAISFGECPYCEGRGKVKID